MIKMSDDLPLSEKDIRLLLSDLDKTKGFKAMLYLVLGTGISIPECITIKLEDVDYKQNLIRIYDKHLSRNRLVKMNPTIIKATSQYQDGRYRASERLFDISEFTAWNRLSQHSQEKLKRTVSWTAIRRTWAVLAFKEGIGFKDMMESSGATADQLSGWSLYAKENGVNKDPPDILANIIRLL